MLIIPSFLAVTGRLPDVDNQESCPTTTVTDPDPPASSTGSTRATGTVAAAGHRATPSNCRQLVGGQQSSPPDILTKIALSGVRGEGGGRNNSDSGNWNGAATPLEIAGGGGGGRGGGPNQPFRRIETTPRQRDSGPYENVPPGVEEGEMVGGGGRVEEKDWRPNVFSDTTCSPSGIVCKMGKPMAYSRNMSIENLFQ